MAARSLLAIPRELVESLLLGPPEDRRLLQDSPILGDVWLAFAANPGGSQDLLVTPHRDVTAGLVAKTISEGIGKKRRREARVAYLQGLVAARLYFDEVLRILVPNTVWWSHRSIPAVLARDFGDPAQMPKRIALALDSVSATRSATRAASTQPHSPSFRLTALDRYVTLAGIILWAKNRKRPAGGEPTIDAIVKQARADLQAIAAELTGIFDRVVKNADAIIFQVSLNRTAMPALDRSVPAVKGDAARNLFKVSCEKINWAVLDSGIDQTHPAFGPPDANGKVRIKSTFDFAYVRELVSADAHELDDDTLEEIIAPTRLRRAKRKAREYLKRLSDDAEQERPINWAIVEEFVTVAEPNVPENGHGTHVAGIIGANGDAAGEPASRTGLCPDIRLYDFRVLARTMDETEFAIIAALQFIRFLNGRQNHVVVHGANLSLSIPHNVRNFACGQTPICLEAQRVVESGVVVVAAAGNFGYQRFETRDGFFEGYAAFSITDPGNADDVITVGSTHGHAPHTYGVSFFSSRGPTGDGRAKPDLVAPGERIEAPLPGGEWGPESGTSMAAPHVSGAAAMLMARYPELIGKPRRIKRILCDSATDLGRERSFQGSGMLDILRALQSI